MANKEGEVNTTVLGASPFAHKGFLSNLGVLLVGWLFWVTNFIKNFVFQGLMSSKPDSDNIANWRGLPFQFFWIAHKKALFCVDLWSRKKKKDVLNLSCYTWHNFQSAEDITAAHKEEIDLTEPLELETQLNLGFRVKLEDLELV